MEIDKTVIATAGVAVIAVYGLYLGNDTIAAAALSGIFGLLIPSPVGG